MRKLLGFLFSVLVGINMFTMTTIASDAIEDESIRTNRDIIVDVESVMRDSMVSYSELVGIEIDDLILNSTNVTRSGSIIVGTYESAEYDAGFPGFTYQIFFDWELEIVGEEYVFKNNNITNAFVTTYMDKAEIEIGWTNYSYTLVKNTYSMASDGMSVTFYTNYEFELQDIYSAHVHTFSQNNTKVIATSDL